MPEDGLHTLPRDHDPFVNYLLLESALSDLPLNSTSCGKMSSTVMALDTSALLPGADQQLASVVPSPTSDAVLRFLDDPFKTWPSTILFVIIFLAIAGISVFLGLRYREVLRYRQCCDAPLTLEAQRANVGEERENAETQLEDDNTGDNTGGHSSDSHLWDDPEPSIRRRPAAAQLTRIVTIGEVREGRIAQRRASASCK